MNSLIQPIIQSIDAQVDAFIAQIVRLNPSLVAADLKTLWNGEVVKSNGRVSEAQPVVVRPKSVLDNNNPLAKLTRKELVEMCKSKGLAHSGTKADLIKHLTSENKAIMTIAKPAVVKITKRPDGTAESADGLVFSASNIVIGEKKGDGVVELSKQQVLKCKQNKLKFKMPQNLAPVVIKVEDAESVIEDDKGDDVCGSDTEEKFEDFEKDLALEDTDYEDNAAFSSDELCEDYV